jgi:hypothetical protein
MNFETPPVNLKVAMARRSLVGLSRRQAGALDRTRLLLERPIHADRIPKASNRPSRV